MGSTSEEEQVRTKGSNVIRRKKPSFIQKSKIEPKSNDLTRIDDLDNFDLYLGFIPLNKYSMS